MRDWAPIAAEASKGDVFLLFYSERTCTMDLAMFGPGSAAGAHFRFIECATGPNAMDFQISTELGRCVATWPDGKFAIVSRDGGYDAVVSYWKKQGVDIRRIAPVHGAPIADPNNGGATYIDPLPDIRAKYMSLLREAGVAEGDMRVYSGILIASMRLPRNERKMNAFTRFKQRYGAADGIARYRTVKGTVDRICAEGPFPPPEAPALAGSLDADPQEGQAPEQALEEKPAPAASADPPAAAEPMERAMALAREGKPLKNLVSVFAPELSQADAGKASIAVNLARQSGGRKTLMKELRGRFGQPKGDRLAARLAPLLAMPKK